VRRSSKHIDREHVEVEISMRQDGVSALLDYLTNELTPLMSSDKSNDWTEEIRRLRAFADDVGASVALTPGPEAPGSTSTHADYR
jgi:hypothetical protein